MSSDPNAPPPGGVLSFVSRVHARVHVGAGSVVEIENVGGNGTRVSGEHTVAKNERRQLHEGQTVVFGRPGHPTERTDRESGHPGHGPGPPV